MMHKENNLKYGSQNSLRYDIGLLEELDIIYGNAMKIVNELIKPPKNIYLRVNTLKISKQELLELFDKNGIKFYEDKNIDYVIYSPINGPFNINIYEKKVFVNKYASDSIYIGSDVYIPGIIYADKIKKGDKVTVCSKDGIPLASGTSIVNFNEIVHLRNGKAVINEESAYRSPKIRELPGFNEGYFYSQSLPSIWAAEIAAIERGHIIVDMNAAPGGKVGCVAQKIGTKAKIIAIDRPSKKKKLEENMERLGYHWVEIVALDSRYASLDLNLKEKADIVIIDPPCTNIGVRPKLSDKKTLRDAIILSKYQKQFIGEAYRMLKPRGTLVYSTCTITYRENENNIRYAESIGFDVEDIKIPGTTKNSYGVRFNIEEGYTGFFISNMKKKG